MATTTTVHAQLIRYATNGDQVIVNLKSAGSDISIDRTSNTKLPTTVTSAQTLANALGSLAFKDSLAKGDVGLGSVDNTADANKSVKYATSAGSAGSATKATQDSGGQQINTTYIKGISISGRTVTITKGDGSTSTQTTQDTNTDTKVAQTAIDSASYTNWRTIPWGASNNGTEGFTPTTVTDGLYADKNLTYQPSSGTLRTNKFKGTLVGTAYEGNLAWGGRNFAGSYGPIDAAMVPELGANRLAFIPAESITVEYSRDGGSTWTAYGASAASNGQLFSTGNAFVVGKADSTNKATANTDKYQLRITIDTDKAKVYTALNKFVIYVSTNGSNNCWCSIDASLESTPTTFKNFANKVSISGWSGYNVINTSTITTYGNSASVQYGLLRFTFGCNGGDTKYNGLQVSKILAYGGIGWSTPSTMASTGHLYSYDSAQNATFPNGVSAKSFTGSLSGTATKATQDSAGQQINTTYIKGVSISGRTVTITKGDGSTSTQTTQDTTYSAMTAATSSAAGKAGLVPAPAAGAQGKFLRGDGSWQTPTNTWRGVQDNLTSTATDQSLSANQGKVLKGLVDARLVRTEWNCAVKGQTWSRLCKVDAKVNVTGSVFLLNVYGTRNSVVYNDTFMIKAHHSSNALISKISGSKYGSTIAIRAVCDSSGNCYVELKDMANGITTATTQSVTCTVLSIACGTITTYTSFTDGTTLPTDFKEAASLTTNTNSLQGNLTWGEITGKPSTFAPSSHTHNYAGSSSAGGSATSAVKLDTATAGSETQPVYFSGGKPVATKYTLGASVPSGAVFTDHTYSAFKGATSSAAGGAGLVPAPATGNVSQFLRGDGQWATPTDTKYSHPNSGVTAGTYKSVTVNAQGHVTGGSNPTTLSGYGITDAAAKSHTHTASQITDNIPASKISGVLSLDNIPQGALERVYVAADDAARLKLTTTQVQNGDVVKVTSTGKMYFVVDQTKLTSEDGYMVFTAGTASAVAWSNVTGKPSSFTPASHTHNYAGASSSGGSATSAVKLDTATAGSETQPVYFSGGKPVATKYTLGKSVPSDAIFTDHTYSAMTAASASAAGASGLVPAPAAGKQGQFLRGDGQWATPTDTKYTHPNSGVTAGTYKSVTVNAQGHVTGGSNPTTLSGYGITDAAAKSHTHNYAGSSSAGGSANSAVKLATARSINGVNFDGSANITVTANPTSNELDNAANLNSIMTPGFYYAKGSNTCTNKPSNVDAFGLIVYKTAAGYTAQILTEGNISLGKTWYRQNNSSAWSDWGYYYSTGYKPSKSDVGLGNVDNTADANKSVKYATSAGSANAVAWANVSGKPSTYTPASHTHNYAGSSSAGGSANSAVKLATARTVSGGTDITMSFSYDGSANSSASLGYYTATAGIGNTNNYPFHRFAKLDVQTGSYVDKVTTFLITQDYTGGGYGIVRIILRTNSSSQVSSAEVKWLVRAGLSADSVQVGLYNVYGKTYADAFYKCTASYAGTVFRAVANGARGAVSRTWTMVNSTEANDTTTSDKKTSTEVYATIAAAGTALHNQAYTNTVSGSDQGTVSYANSAGSANAVAWSNVTGKPSSASSSASGFMSSTDKSKLDFGDIVYVSKTTPTQACIWVKLD